MIEVRNPEFRLFSTSRNEKIEQFILFWKKFFFENKK